MNSPSSVEKDLPASVVRIVDANANRATEGLRVLEEYLRFELEDAALCEQCKAIRHQVSKTVRSLVPNAARMACRSTDTDVGIHVQVASEYQREGTREVALANAKRVTESLRVLEEYSKLSSGQLAREFESLRYQAYTLEKTLGHLHRAAEMLTAAQLYVLIDESFGWGDTFWRRCDQLLSSEVDVVQLRAKQTTDRQVIEVACRLSQRCRDAGKLLIVNDRADIARVAQADGVHLGQEELSPAEARLIVGPRLLIGISTHSLEQVRRAIRSGADYIGVGPVFPSKTKNFDQHVGLELVSQVNQQFSLPSFAIGGIDQARLADVVAAGATRFAVSHAIWHAEDVDTAARRMKALLSP